MNGDYKSTHELILNTALQMFLEKGFEKTSLRDICKKCNVTTGAFYKHFKDKEDVFCQIVQPVIDQIDAYFVMNANRFLDASTSKSELNDFYHSYSHGESVRLVDFMYNNYDLLKLLVEGSHGTKYEDFIEYMALKSDQGMIDGSSKFSQCDVPFDISLEEMHILNHAYYSCLAQIMKRNYTKDQALRYICKMGDFFSAGYEKTVFKMD